jgi:ankyrin repeat protein
MVEFLLSWGADVNAADQLGGTPLHYAAQAGNSSLATLLIKRGATSIPDLEGKCPEDIALDKSHQTEEEGYVKIGMC